MGTNHPSTLPLSQGQRKVGSGERTERIERRGSSPPREDLRDEPGGSPGVADSSGEMVQSDGDFLPPEETVHGPARLYALSAAHHQALLQQSGHAPAPAPGGAGGRAVPGRRQEEAARLGESLRKPCRSSVCHSRASTISSSRASRNWSPSSSRSWRGSERFAATRSGARAVSRAPLRVAAQRTVPSHITRRHRFLEALAADRASG